MVFALDTLALGVPDVAAARTFYTSVFAPETTDSATVVTLDMHGTAKIALQAIETLADHAQLAPAASGFRGYVLSSIVSQPSEVETLVHAAVQGGATVLKPAKKGIFGGFSAVFRAPDGTVWKLSSQAKKDTDAAKNPPQPSETAIFLGVAEPKSTKGFYTALGLSVDRDYGNKFVDFTVAPKAWRVGLMPRKDLAKDAGVDAAGEGFHGAAPTHVAYSREEVDTLISTATSVGGRVVLPASETSTGGYRGYVSDPDGFVWQIAAG